RISSVRRASVTRMMASPSPVHDTPPSVLSAYVPHPMSAESPTRPGSLPDVPPVDVAAAMVPARSSATAPTVPPAGAAGSPQPGRRRGGAAEGTRAVQGTGAGVEGVAPIVENAARERDRVAAARDGGHRARPERIALHDGGVRLHGARRGEHGAPARVEARMV